MTGRGAVRPGRHADRHDRVDPRVVPAHVRSASEGRVSAARGADRDVRAIAAGIAARGGNCGRAPRIRTRSPREMLATYRAHNDEHHDVLIRPFQGVDAMLDRVARVRAASRRGHEQTRAFRTARDGAIFPGRLLRGRDLSRRHRPPQAGPGAAHRSRAATCRRARRRDLRRRQRARRRRRPRRRHADDRGRVGAVYARRPRGRRSRPHRRHAPGRRDDGRGITWGRASALRKSPEP